MGFICLFACARVAKRAQRANDHLLNHCVKSADLINAFVGPTKERIESRSHRVAIVYRAKSNSSESHFNYRLLMNAIYVDDRYTIQSGVNWRWERMSRRRRQRWRWPMPAGVSCEEREKRTKRTHVPGAQVLIKFDQIYQTKLSGESSQIGTWHTPDGNDSLLNWPCTASRLMHLNCVAERHDDCCVLKPLTGN